CRASNVERHFHLDAGPPGLRAVAPRLHTATRPQAWNTWTRLAGQAPATTEGQRFEHFYLSLQAAGACPARRVQVFQACGRVAVCR
ncbi:hypothetical protein ACV33R_31725, partial [Pseudomonas aeruginosa]